MNKRLIICNTLYQLIVAIQIHLSFMGKTILVLTNEIKNAEKISRRLRETNVFESISVLDVKKQKRSWKYLKECIFGIVPPELSNVIVDELIGFNFDLPSHALYAGLYKKNKDICISKMEEGLLSYNTLDTTCGVMKNAYRLRSLLCLKNLKPSTQKFYCFSPEAYAGDLMTVAIPRIKKDDMMIQNIFNHVFGREIIKPYKEKYIFLSCIYDKEGGKSIGELDLAMRVAELVGKDNLIVKVHPRDDINRYKEKGLKIDSNSSIPWEVIQINQDFSRKILITTLSSSLLNFNPVLEQTSKVYYGYKLCNISENELATHYRFVLEGYLDNEVIGLRNISVLEQLEDLIS